MKYSGLGRKIMYGIPTPWGGVKVGVNFQNIHDFSVQIWIFHAILNRKICFGTHP